MRPCSARNIWIWLRADCFGLAISWTRMASQRPDTASSNFQSDGDGVLSGKRTKIIDPQSSDFAGHVVGHLAEEITFFRWNGIDLPTFVVVGEFDSREMIEMADDQDARGVKLLKDGLG